jgi:hypothetical protein
MVYDDKTVVQAILLLLKENNIEAYPPATKKGECIKEYVVVKNAGSSQIGNYSSEVHYVDVLCYVPQNKYTELESFKNHVKQIIHNNLYPRVMETGSETEDYYDEDIKGHMVSFILRNNVRNNFI